MKTRQKTFRSEAQILRAIEETQGKLAAKCKEMELLEQASKDMAKEAHEWDEKVSSIDGRVTCLRCEGKAKNVFGGTDFCQMCKGLGWCNQEAVSAYACGLRQNSILRQEEARKMAKNDTLALKLRKLKRALAAFRTEPFPLFAQNKNVVLE